MEAKTRQQFPVNFSDSEYDTLSLNIPRARDLADVMQAADQSPSPIVEEQSIGACISLLWEILDTIARAWEGAQDRRREERAASRKEDPK